MITLGDIAKAIEQGWVNYQMREVLFGMILWYIPLLILAVGFGLEIYSLEKKIEKIKDQLTDLKVKLAEIRGSNSSEQQKRS